MPVELNKIPAKEPSPKAPNKITWFIVTIFIAVVWIICTLFFWPNSISTNTAWFWFCIIAVPFLVGGGCYACRLHFFENERDRIAWWNHLHQEQYDRQVLHGQRAVAILGKAYITPGACNKLASVLVQGNCMLQSYFSPHRQATVTSARLAAGSDIFTFEKYRQRLAHYVENIIKMLKPELDNIDEPLSIRLRHDGSLEDEQILSVWQQIFPSTYSVAAINLFVQDDGLMWLDTWLDSNDVNVMLSVEINLFLDDRDNQSESVSALLLASPEWQENHTATVIANVHRPVMDEGQSNTVEDTALWGRLTRGEAFTLWRVQLKDKAMGEILQKMERSGYLPGLQNDYLLDDLFGKPGAAVGNIALICASEHAQTTGEAQWGVIQDVTPHQFIVRSVS
ncbi:hypothetical protein ACQKDS_04135 [Serratia sp. NPDC078593]|uniref:hypothetical protein n=1 Tax=unclassified Serratia (in: enterobacteria) TaxID=2647522 RepID=UPI0037D86A70